MHVESGEILGKCRFNRNSKFTTSAIRFLLKAEIVARYFHIYTTAGREAIRANESNPIRARALQHNAATQRCIKAQKIQQSGPEQMVGLPDRVGRCTTCKRRKVKCDLSRPACSRCSRLGLRCEYLIPLQGQTFINRTVTNPFVKAVDIFSDVAKAKLAKNLGPSQAIPSIYQCEGPNLCMLKSPDHAPEHRMQLLSAFIEVYVPTTARSSVQDLQTPESWIYLLPDITMINSAYNKSLAALCLAQLGIWNRDTVLMSESFQLYGSALGELKKTISCRNLGTPEATLASIAILSTYEVFSGPSGQDSGWISHVRGGSRILQLLGPSICTTPVGSLLFTKIRGLANVEAFRTRQTSILAGLEWQCCANERQSHGLYCHLLGLMIRLPPIMEEFDILTVSANKTTERPTLIRLLRLCSSLNGQLLSWNEKLEKHVEGKLFWTVRSVANSPADDPILGRVFPLAFQFPSLRVAQLLLLYWSLLVLLYRTIQDIQKRLNRQEAGDTAKPRSVALNHREGREVFLKQNCPSDDQIAVLANNISQSLEYCYHTRNGTLGLQTTIFPFWVSRNFYESQSDRSRELAWCSALGNISAPDSQFDLHVMRLSGNGQVAS